MRLPKWLLLQMTKTEITCSKKEGGLNHLLFFIVNPCKTDSNGDRDIKVLPKCCQNKISRQKKNHK